MAAPVQGAIGGYTYCGVSKDAYLILFFGGLLIVLKYASLQPLLSVFKTSWSSIFHNQATYIEYWFLVCNIISTQAEQITVPYHTSWWCIFKNFKFLGTEKTHGPVSANGCVSKTGWPQLWLDKGWSEFLCSLRRTPFVGSLRLNRVHWLPKADPSSRKH